MKKYVIVLFALLTLLSGAVSSSQAQRPTQIYGSAYQQWWTGVFFTYSPYATVTVTDESGRTRTAQTNSLSNWWLDDMPSNRWYTIQARSKTWPYPWSNRIRVYVPEKPWYLRNATRVDDLICR